MNFVLDERKIWILFLVIQISHSNPIDQHLWLGSIKLSSVESPNFFLVTISLSEISVIRIQIAEFTILQNSIQDLNVRVFELAITITLRT